MDTLWNTVYCVENRMCGLDYHNWPCSLCKSPLYHVILYFVFQYSMIISLEEEKLSTIFGQDYSKYKNNVPRIVPLIIPWDNKSKVKPNPILNTLKTEKRTLQNIFLLVFIIISKPYIINFTF